MGTHFTITQYQMPPANKAIVTDKDYFKANDKEPTGKAIDTNVQIRNTFNDNIVTAAH